MEFKFLLASLFFVLGGGMMTDSDQWRAIGGCAVGGGFGGVVATFFNVVGKEKIDFSRLFLMWIVNFCFSVFGGSLVILYMLQNMSLNIGPLACIAAGGLMGAFGILIVGPLLPFVVKVFSKKIEKLIDKEK